MDSLYKKIEAGQSSQCVILVPRRVSVNRIQKELVDKYGFIFDLKIFTIPEFLRTLSVQNRELPGSVPDAVAQEIIAQLAKSLGKNETSFYRLLRKTSGQKLALTTLQSLILADISPEELSACQVENISKIAALYRDYISFTRANGIADRALWQMRIIEAIEQGLINISSVTDIFVYDFNSIPGHLKRLFATLKKNSSLHFNLPNDPERAELFHTNCNFIQDFELPRTSWHLPYPEDGPLSEIQKHLFGDRTTAVEKKPDGLTFHQAPGRFDEVEAAAVKISELILDHGVSPSRIAISTRSLGEYNQYFEAVMEKFKLPYSYRRGIPILQSPLIRLIMKMMECQGQMVKYDRLMAILRSSFMPFADKSWGWQKLIAKSGIFKETLAGWAEKLEQFYADPPGEERYQKKSRELFELHHGKELIEQIEHLNEGIVAIFKSSSPLQELERFCKSELAEIETLADAKTWQRHLDTFFRLLASIRSNNNIIKGVGLTPLLSPLDQLREELKEATIHEKQYLDETVSVITTFDLGYQEVDHLFIVGMDEHTIPKVSFSSNILLSDSDIAAMKSAGITRAKDIASSYDRRISEEQAFVLAIGSARKTIALYHPTLSSDGKELSPSPYFAEMLRLSGSYEVSEESGGDTRSIVDCAPEIHSLRRQLARHLFRTDIKVNDADTLYLLDKLKEKPEEQDFISRLIALRVVEDHRTKALFEKEQITLWSGKLSQTDELARTFGSETREWSASALQTYASCPFEFFLKYVLGLEEHELPGEELDPRYVGSFFHGILKKFVDKADYPLSSFESSQALMKEVIDAEFGLHESPIDELHPVQKLLHQRTTDVMDRFIWYELENKTGIPEQTEFAFSGATCKIALSDGKEICLRGSFDRVDKLPDENARDFLVIDYKLKSGKTKVPRQDKFPLGANLQMPLYLLAAAKLLATHTNNIEGRFIGLGEMDEGKINNEGAKWVPIFRTEDKSSPEQISLVEIIEKILSDITSGEFPVQTRDGSGVNNLTNLVGRWLELPPELVGE